MPILYGMTSHRRLSPGYHQAAAIIREAWEASVYCPRCDGEGYLDRDDWVVTEDDGSRVCFRCRGTGTTPRRPFVEPIRVRMAVVAKLKRMIDEGDLEGIEVARAKDESSLYWPVLQDAYDRALLVVEGRAEEKPDRVPLGSALRPRR